MSPLLPKRIPLRILRTALALASMLALWWYVLVPYLSTVLILPTETLLRVLAPDVILGIGFVQGKGWMVLTTLAPLEFPTHLLQFRLELTRFTVAFPLYWGLVLAIPAKVGDHFYQIVMGTFLLIFPGVMTMAALYALFQIALVIQHQPALTQIPPPFYVAHWPYPTWVYHLLGVGRQLSLLVLPTTFPLLVWSAFNLDTLRRVLQKTGHDTPS